MVPRPRPGSRIVVVVCAVLGTCVTVRAQSAVDGFDAGTNGQVNAVAVQADGQILVGGAGRMWLRRVIRAKCARL